MNAKTSKGILGIVGGAVAAAFLAVIAIGQGKKNVEQSQPLAWRASCSKEASESWPTVCGEPGTDRAAIEEAVEAAHDVRMGYRGPVFRTTCPREPGWISVRIDPLLDDAGPAGIDMDDGWSDLGLPGRWGVATVSHDLEGAPGSEADGHGRERIRSVEIAMHPDAGPDAYVHEITGHGAGFQHLRGLAPSGNIMHPSDPGSDLRGMDCVPWK
jgi:hypothetical protein